MTKTIQREIRVPQPREQVWRAITDSETLAEWMFPNDFQPRVGHRFTFRVPGNAAMNFDGLTVRCEVLECDPPRGAAGGKLVFTWSAGGAVENTRVSFQLKPDGEGTRVLLEHSGFDVSQPFGEQAFAGAGYGWAKMFKQLMVVVAGLPNHTAIRTERVLSASPRAIFAAFERADQLAQWWGPAGFTNTFETFEFKPGGRWIFVMHAPNGANHPNESVFREIQPDTKIVIDHVVQPLFTLTVTLSPQGEKTRLTWVQAFESPEFVTKMRDFLQSANEQNLDRLEALLTKNHA